MKGAIAALSLARQKGLCRNRRSTLNFELQKGGVHQKHMPGVQRWCPVLSTKADARAPARSWAVGSVRAKPSPALVRAGSTGFIQEEKPGSTLIHTERSGHFRRRREQTGRASGLSGAREVTSDKTGKTSDHVKALGLSVHALRELGSEPPQKPGVRMFQRNGCCVLAKTCYTCTQVLLYLR